MLTLLGRLGDWAFMTWLLSCVASTFMPAVKSMRAELRPFALPGLLVAYACYAAQHGLGPWDVFWLVIELVCWWVWYRDGGDDDRWKRRRRRAVEKVTEVAGKLTVVPEGNPT